MGGSLLKAALIVVSIVAVLIFLLWLGQRRLIYLPDAAPVPPAADVIPDAEDAVLTTDDGLELGAWYIPPRGDDRGVTVLVANGNGGNRAARADLADALADAGLAVLLFDYRGYGGNPGSPTEEGLARDVRAAYAYLVEVRGLTPGELLYFGESLGAGVVAELATRHPPAGMLLRSPFPDLATVAQRHYPILPTRLLLRDHYPVADHVRAVDVPITVVYGSEDSIVPPEQSQEVAAAGEAVEVVGIDGAGHNDPAMFSGPGLIAAVVELAERAAPRHDR